ncbi:hypothetical protein E2562_014289 [Oryza meyeriana var. granulata]|uniref:Uncharacterized protein n=1 Tax=Oryza meyeriana var. granulata TaxID=110450 RepID=A0A6G1C663_9ORYZ|nr:hypothetical protein E2562_014289 [Oryza meyeriana var. granulata]
MALVTSTVSSPPDNEHCVTTATCHFCQETSSCIHTFNFLAGEENLYVFPVQGFTMKTAMAIWRYRPW